MPNPTRSLAPAGASEPIEEDPAMREFAMLVGLTLVLVLAVVLMLALFPYLSLIGFVLVGLLSAGTLGGLLLGGYRMWDYIAHRQLDRARKRLELALLQR